MVTVRLIEGQLSIPAEIWEAALLDDGDELEVEVTEQGILLRPVREQDLDLSWFQTPEGEARLQEAVDAVRSGKQWIFESGEEFVATLQRLSADDADV
jgi:bifunctional DNA-binding transcriptional regulator/antitoxin component of YhaV-PrlF toxin-antitoxin module